MAVLRESGFSHWDLKLAIMGMQERGLDAYSWLEDYHKAQAERSLPVWRHQPYCGPVLELPSVAERDAKEKELVLAVLSLLKEKSKKEADEQVSSWEENEVASKKYNKCFWITATLLSIGAIIAGAVPCAHK